MKIQIEDRIKEACPGYRLVKFEADVVNGPTPEELSKEIEQLCGSMREVMEIADINKRPGIAATRAVYKACGKEPNRYRPSTEALCRRIISGKELYQVNAVVDAMNVLSIKSGYSVGAFDMDKIDGDTLSMGVGREGEPYEGIGRGPLNISGLPVLRDRVGGVGSPTSDNERTKFDEDSRHLLVTVHIFGEEMDLDTLVTEASRLLETYCQAENISAEIVTPS
ncbi:MAG: hypothetical protein K2G40_07640 [Muribaculaceae bacterium]|nr:hypothetical protein [Muribaculaceae bacterium]